MPTDRDTPAGAAADGAAKALGFPGLIALLGSNVLVFLGLFSLAPLLPALKAHFGDTGNVDLLTQLVGATAGSAFALGSLFVGRLITRFGYRGVYIASLFAFAAAGAVAPIFGNLYAIIATRVIVGFASAGIVNAALVAIGRLLPAPARTLGLQVTIGSVVGIVGFPLVGQLARLDWRLGFETHLFALLFVPLALTLPIVGQTDIQRESSVRGRGVGALVLSTAIFVGMVIFIGTI